MTAQRKLRRQHLTVVALAVLLPLAGCGGGSDSPPPDAAAATAQAEALPPLAPATSLDDNHQVGDLYWPDGDTSTGGQGQPVGSLTCGNVPDGYHVHAHLSIFLNGRALAVPQLVGIIAATDTQPACDYLVHTHDLSGKIHLHGSAPTTYTLGQLFQVWGQTLSMTDIAGITSLPIVIYVTDNNANVTKYTGDPAAIELISHREITIQIGTAVSAIPNFTWTGA